MEYLKTTINKIEQNISEKINVEKLSWECFISTRQLYRDFYSLTGHSVNEYIRKRKLSKALSLLKHSDMIITDIAYSCGYSSVQALCRSIKSSLNITPTEYRNNTVTYYFPRYDEINTKQITVKKQTIPKMICIKYYNSKLTGIEDKAVFCLLSTFPGYTGRLFGRNGAQTGSRFCYELYIEYNETCIWKLSSAFEDIYVYPEYTAVFACTPVINDEHEINAAWDFLYGHWLKGSMFEQDNIPYFEEYIIKENRIKKLILYLPVRQRENFYKINIKSFDDRSFVVASDKGIYANKSAGEKAASNIVADFIAGHYPYLLKTQKEFYVSRYDDVCTCGIKINNTLNIPSNKTVKKLLVPKGFYAVLEGSCYGSGGEYEQVLLDWLKDNGFETVGEPFSIYDTSNGTDKDKIIVKSQIKIKDGRI